MLFLFLGRLEIKMNDNSMLISEGVISKSLEIIFIHKFLRILVKPFNKTKAFDLGIIDANGYILKKHKTLKTKEEKDAYTLFHRIVWKF